MNGVCGSARVSGTERECSDCVAGVVWRECVTCGDSFHGPEGECEMCEAGSIEE